MNWLETLKNDMLAITKVAAYEYFPAMGPYAEPYCNPRFDHVVQVEKEALKLLEVYHGDRDTVLASVWVHDRYKPVFDGPGHGNKAADWVLENLEKTGFPQEKVKAVEYAVRNHDDAKKELVTLEAKILWDADKLSHYGPSTILEDTFMFSSEKICTNFFKVKYEPTLTLDYVIPVLLEFNPPWEIGHNAPNSFYLEESKKIGMEKVEAVKALLTALQKRL